MKFPPPAPNARDPGFMTTLATSLEQRLERGEIVTFEPCPFALPIGDDRSFLLQQQLRSSAHKNISYNPADDSVWSFVNHSAEQAARVRDLMREFSRNACAWLASQLPAYAAGWQSDRATLRTEEEATRKLRLTARN